MYNGVEEIATDLEAPAISLTGLGVKVIRSGLFLHRAALADLDLSSVDFRKNCGIVDLFLISDIRHPRSRQPSSGKAPWQLG